MSPLHAGFEPGSGSNNEMTPKVAIIPSCCSRCLRSTRGLKRVSVCNIGMTPIDILRMVAGVTHWLSFGNRE